VGAYGAAYASQLFEIGIFSAAASHQIPVPSVQIGEALAREFASGFGAVGDRYIDAIERGAVSLGDLDAFMPMTPSGIPRDATERQLYQNLLFAEAGIARPEDLDRRKSLLLILNLAQRLGHAPDAARAAVCGSTLRCTNSPTEVHQEESRRLDRHPRPSDHFTRDL
jgi:hypothetical protein